MTELLASLSYMNISASGKPFIFAHPVQSCFMSTQSEAATVLCKPIGAKLWPSTSSRPTISKRTKYCTYRYGVNSVTDTLLSGHRYWRTAPVELQLCIRLFLHIRKYHLADPSPNTRFYRACRTYANFLYLVPILQRFNASLIQDFLENAEHTPTFLYHYYTDL